MIVPQPHFVAPVSTSSRPILVTGRPGPRLLADKHRNGRDYLHRRLLLRRFHDVSDSIRTLDSRSTSILDPLCSVDYSSPADEKEEIDLPILKLTPEPPSEPLEVTTGSISSTSTYTTSYARPRGDTLLSSSSSVSSTSTAIPEQQVPHHQQFQQQKSSLILGQVSRGIRPPLTHTNSLSQLPKYGVELKKEEESKLEQVMKDIDLWGMDMFNIRELSSGHPLLSVFYTILKVSSSDMKWNAFLAH